MTIEVQCTSCHTRYRIDEQVLPEGTPTFKCSRCGHVFTLDPRGSGRAGQHSGSSAPAPEPPASAPSSPLAASAGGAETAQGSSPNRGEARRVGSESTPPGKALSESQSEPADSGAPDSAARSPGEDDAAPTGIEGSRAGSAPPVSSEEKRISADEMLAKPFRPEESSSPGENLKFDFNDDYAAPENLSAGDEIDRDRSEWQVGESDLDAPEPANEPPSPPPLPGEAARTDQARPGSRSRRPIPQKRPLSKEPAEFLDEDAAPVYNRTVATHSARFFVGMLVLLGLGYGVMTVLIRSAPATAADILSRLPRIGDRFVQPIVPARLVAMRDVHSDYLRTKGGHTALVVTGIAENVGRQPLHAVQIAATLRDPAEHPLANRAVYCGNNLSAPMVAQMTPHELEFFQKLDPPRAFALAPAATSPFVIVFIDPPAAVSRFDVSVATAEALVPAPADASG